MGAFEGIAGHRRALRVLESQLASGHLAHAYLFVGEPQLGKTAVARRLAQALLPEVPLSRHPDYWEDDRRTVIKIDEVRLLPSREPEAHSQTLQAFLALKPAVGKRRVAVISNVGRMPDQTQGILLKTLEEPHPDRVIVLTTPSVSPFVVLPTIVSRCQRVSFHAVPEPEIAQLLVADGAEAARADELARLSRGRPGWATSAAAEGGALERHERWAEMLRAVVGAPRDVPLTIAAELDHLHMAWRNGDAHDVQDPFLEAMESWQLEIRQRMLGAAHPATWARLLELSYDSIGHHEQYVSPRLNLECFLLQVRRAA
jgi:DNA polymerase-3 subunit delta'